MLLNNGANSGRYEGTIFGWLFGDGKRIYDDGSVYESQFLFGIPRGMGKMTYADGAVYEGEFLDGEPRGKGKISYEDGRVYEGDFLGERHWMGKITNAYGTVYQGEFLDGVQLGKGKRTYKDGTSYEGEFQEGIPHGRGAKTNIAGHRFIGEFRNGAFLEGIMEVGHTTVYNVEHRNGRLEGRIGNLIVYLHQGKFDEDGMWHGEARWDDHPFGRYEGGIRDGVPHGKGKLTRGTGIVYEGEFSGSWPAREGKLIIPPTRGRARYWPTFSSGAIYEGEISQNLLPDGLGRLETNGSVCSGEFNFTEWTLHLKYGQCTFPDGMKYKGDVRFPSWRGTGEYTSPSGVVYNGMIESGSSPAGMGLVDITSYNVTVTYPDASVFRGRNVGHQHALGENYIVGIGQVDYGAFVQWTGKVPYNFRRILPYGDNMPMEKEKMVYSDGDVYSPFGKRLGVVDQNLKPHGRGEMVYANGLIYWGQFSHGQPDGTEGYVGLPSGDRLYAGDGLRGYGYTGPPFLIQAAKDGNLSALHQLLKAGFDPDVQDGNGYTPLHSFVWGRKDDGFTMETIRILLRAGADPNVPDRRGNTVLHAVVYVGPTAAVPLLLAHGADPEKMDRDGVTLSVTACGTYPGQLLIASILGVPLGDLGNYAHCKRLLADRRGR